MKKPRTSAVKIYFVVYMDKRTETFQTYIPAQNAQQAVDYLRKTEGEEIFITTVARVVNNYK